ncbi:MAG: hypothetical protein ABSG28_09585 [Methanoregula sp.]|uniref:hypothetical protein n=1 Tax=Methanoregula sp. TaxID=2052170 RepID=UPI003C287C0E
MNTHHANIAGHAVAPDIPGAAARPCAGILPGRPVERLSGIRSSGQYCTPPGPTKAGSLMTVHRITRGRSAVPSMCP